MIEIAKIARSSAASLFAHGLSRIDDIINEQTWPDLIKMARGTSDISCTFLFVFTLPSIKHIIREDNLDEIVEGVLLLGKIGHHNIFGKVVPSLKHVITAENWKSVTELLYEYNTKTGDYGQRNVSLLWGLPYLRNAITSANFPLVLQKCEEVRTSLRLNDLALFQNGFPAIEDIVDEGNIIQILDKIKEVCERLNRYNHQNVNAVSTVFMGLNSIKQILTGENFNDVMELLMSVFESEILVVRTENRNSFFRYALPEFNEKIRSLGDLAYIITTYRERIANIINGEFDNEDRRWFFEYIVGVFRKNLKHFDDYVELVTEYVGKVSPIIRDDFEPVDKSLFFYPILNQFGEGVEHFDDFVRLVNDYLENKDVLKKGNIDILLHKADPKNGIGGAIERFKKMMEDPRYVTFQGLTELGFLCCHVTNAFFGGAAGNNEKKKDIFDNIVYDIMNPDSYNPSCSVIRPHGYTSLVVTSRDQTGGSIGVVYDYGYIYQSFRSDAATTDETDEVTGSTIRRGNRDRSTSTALVVNLSKSSYNEVLVQKWTVSGIFYTKGVKDWAIAKLLAISQRLSGRKHFNGEHWYNQGAPKKVIKWFPVYEIDLKDNTWKAVFDPKHQKIGRVERAKRSLGRFRPNRED